MKEQFVAKRIVNIGLIFLVAIGVSVIAGMMGRMYLDLSLIHILRQMNSRRIENEDTFMAER